ncbi:MAG: hypothetical protein OHK0039_20150 [Bacteroidia bacterium]
MKSFLHTLVSAACLVLLVLPYRAQAQTFVNGTISSDTVWSPLSNPIIVDANLVIPPNVRLTILPGVEVRVYPGVVIGVRGELRALGLDTAYVRFAADTTLPVTGMWRGIYVGGRVRMRHVEGHHARTFLKFTNGGTATSELLGSVFTRNDTAVFYDGAAPDSLRMVRCLVANNQVGMVADSNTIIRNSIFKDNFLLGLQGYRISVVHTRFADNATGARLFQSRIRHCTFVGNSDVALAGGNSSVVDCDFYHNHTGILTQPTAFTYIRRNEFRFNGTGIRFGANAPSVVNGAFIHQNTFCDNLLYNASTLLPATTTVNLQGNCWCETDSAAIAATTYDQNDDPSVGLIDFMPFDTTTCLDDRVYPGDANYNQVANVFDLFPIGLKYGQTGPQRPNATVQWVGQPSPDWGDTLLSGVDIKHVDCNGDGTINLLDVGAIFLNYGKTHNSMKTSGSTTGTPLRLLMPSSDQNPGDTLHMELHLGSPTEPAAGIYGLAFSLSYDSTAINPASTQVSFDGSWFGTTGTNMIALAHTLSSEGYLEVGMVGIDQTARMGYGKIADITVVIDEDIFKAGEPVAFYFETVQAVGVQAEDVPLAPQAGEITVTTAIEHPLAGVIELWPNPAADRVSLQSPVAIGQITLRGLRGEPLWQRGALAPHQTLDIDTAGLPAGTYFLTLQTAEGPYTKSLLIIR